MNFRHMLFSPLTTPLPVLESDVICGCSLSNKKIVLSKILAIKAGIVYLHDRLGKMVIRYVDYLASILQRIIALQIL